MNKIKKRLSPRNYNGIEYILGSDIRKFHGKMWTERWSKLFGVGNTGLVIPAGDPSHKKKTNQFGIYYHDYIRFANLLDYNIPTYFD